MTPQPHFLNTTLIPQKPVSKESLQKAVDIVRANKKLLDEHKAQCTDCDYRCNDL